MRGPVPAGCINSSYKNQERHRPASLMARQRRRRFRAHRRRRTASRRMSSLFCVHPGPAAGSTRAPPHLLLDDPFQKIGDTSPHLRALNAGESDRNAGAFLGPQGFGDGAHARVAGRSCRMFFEAGKEIAHRQVETLCYGVQTPGADAVRAIFVFLNLLEAHADGIPECFLRNATYEFQRSFQISSRHDRRTSRRLYPARAQAPGASPTGNSGAAPARALSSASGRMLHGGCRASSFDVIDEVECRSTDVEHGCGHKSPQKSQALSARAC